MGKDLGRGHPCARQHGIASVSRSAERQPDRGAGHRRHGAERADHVGGPGLSKLMSLPHLLLWGMQDTALLPESRDGLERFCDDLTLHEHDDASHWILHEQPDWVEEKMDRFLSD